MWRLYTQLARKFNRDYAEALGITSPAIRLLTLLHERGQLVGLGLGKSARINTGIENDEAMAEGFWEIASDKKRNAHFLERMHECKRILRIGAGMGPKYGDLKREGFRKLLE